jgi:hypothetical protein
VSSELRLALFWRFASGVGAIVAPVLAYVVVALIVEGHATKEYFEAVSQILPVLLLALAVEQGYFTRAGRERAPQTPLQLELAGRSLVDEQKMARCTRWRPASTPSSCSWSSGSASGSRSKSSPPASLPAQDR